MKINELVSGQPLGAGTVGKRQGNGDATAFQEILASELRSLASPAPMESIAAPSPTSAPSAGLRLDSLLTTEHTIATLEKFSAALENPAFSDNDLEPFASELENDTLALVDLKKQLSGDDPLAALLDRVATVSYIEAAKFRRGDYSA